MGLLRFAFDPVSQIKSKTLWDMVKMANDRIGIDISKDNLDVYRLSDGRAARFANAATGFRDLARWLGSDMPTRVVYDATGRYHAGIEKRFAGTLPLCKMNPLQARRFAQSKGTRAKTDAVSSRRCKHRLPGNGCKDAGGNGCGLRFGRGSPD